MAKQRAIKIEVFADAEAWLRENIDDISGSSIGAVQPLGKIDLNGVTEYQDVEEGDTKDCTLNDHVNALELLTEQIGKTILAGGIENPHDLRDTGNWDWDVADAFFQLVFYGEIKYDL